MHPVDDIIRFVDTFVTTSFSRDDRHARRIAMLSRYEETGELPPLAENLER